MKKIFPKNPALGMAVGILSLFVLFAPAQTQSDNQNEAQHQIERAKIFRDAYPLISETDLYCSIYVHESELPDLRITAAEKGYEKILFADSDNVYLNKGKQGGLEIGQVFLVVELGKQIGGFGYLATKRGRAHIIFLEDERAVARVEKSCGQVMVGNYLLPFEEKESMLGKDIGYEPYTEGDSGAVGTIIYLERDYAQIGSGGWAIIDIGEEAGVQVGQQMTIYKRTRDPQTLKIREDLPRIGIGNLVVIDVAKKTATVKVLSCSDPVSLGQQVQGK